MEITKEKKAFEYLFQLELEKGNPDGINPDYEEGILKGIVDMAYFAEIITSEELAQYYKEISKKYSVVKRLSREFNNKKIAN